MSFRVVFAAATAAALLAPAAVARPAAAESLDVMSYNINRGAPSGKRLEAIAKVIASSGADVADLQQVRRFARNAKKGSFGCVDQPAELASTLERLTGETWHFYKGTAKPRSARVIQNWTSDHRPVVARFSVK